MVNRLLSQPDIAEPVQRALCFLAGKLLRRRVATFKAMAQGFTLAIEAFHAILTDPRILPYIGDVIPDLLTGMDSYGKTGLSNALEHGHAGTIAAYHALLRQLLKEPAVAPLIERNLPRLLATTNQDGTSGLLYASNHGHTAAITAYHTMLNDPIIRLPLEAHTPHVRAGETSEPL